MMTIALGIETLASRQVLTLSISNYDLFFALLATTIALFIALGLLADLLLGLTIGTITLWPVVLGIGIFAGVLALEVLSLWKTKFSTTARR